MAKTVSGQKSIENTLLEELRFSGLDKEYLKELVTVVAGLQKAGLKKFKAFPKGTPRPDGLRVTGVVDASESGKILGDILTKTQRFGGIVLFPYGIPFPDIFRVRIDIGSPIEAEATNQF